MKNKKPTMNTQPRVRDKIGGIDILLHQRLHQRLRHNHGSASKCEHCNNPDRKHFEWALKKGHEYSDNPEDYFQLCISCHRKYDFTEEIREKFRKGKTGKLGGLNNSSRAICKIDRYTDEVIKVYPSIIDAERENEGYRAGSISNVLSGDRKTVYGFKWKYYEED